MKSKKLPKKSSGHFFRDEEAIKKPVKTSKPKREKKLSIYDDLEELDDYGSYGDINLNYDFYETDYEDDEDIY
ncbi:hypothetical protein QA597_08440 [Marinilabiliaceae bacterium ANBcel2]|nr:hypothetical protein [Marinilabiliaceae bacterium ANBcel2]